MLHLHKYGIYHNNVKRALFDNFITKQGNEHYLQKFLIFCSTLNHYYITDIIRDFEFTLNDGLTYKQLFLLHPDWKIYFHENTDIFGYPKDNRIGVQKQTAHTVMRLLQNTNGNLDKAIQLTFNKAFPI